MGKLDTAVSPAWTKRPAPNKEIGCEGTLGKLTQVHAALCGTPMSELCSMPQYKVCWKGSVNPNFSQETEELINSCRKRTIVVDKNLEMDLTFDCAMCLDDGDGCPNIQYSMINAANTLGSPELFIIQITRADGVRIIGYASVTGFSMDGITDDDNSIVTDTVTLSFQDEFEVLPKDQKCIDWHGVAFLDAGFQTAIAGFEFLDENGNGLVAGDSTGFFPANPTGVLPWYDGDVTTSSNSVNGDIIDYTIGEGCALPPVCQICVTRPDNVFGENPIYWADTAEHYVSCDGGVTQYPIGTYTIPEIAPGETAYPVLELDEALIAMLPVTFQPSVDGL